MSSDVIQSFRDYKIQFSAAAGRYFVQTAARGSKPIADVVTAECRAAVLALKPDWGFAEDVEIYTVDNGFHGKVGSLAPEFTLRVSLTALKLRSLTEDSEQINDPTKFLLTQIAKGLAGKLGSAEGFARPVLSVVNALPTRNI